LGNAADASRIGKVKFGVHADITEALSTVDRPVRRQAVARPPTLLLPARAAT
jgi:hypothetical protein